MQPESVSINRWSFRDLLVRNGMLGITTEPGGVILSPLTFGRLSTVAS